MRRTAALAALALVALTAAAVATAAPTEGGLEKLRLTKADNALARAISVQRSDLSPGWTVDRSPAPKREAMTCPGYAPDLSRFTITGLGYSAFKHPAGGVVTSAVELYPSRAQAVGDFRAGLQPGLLACLRKTLQASLDDESPSGYTARVVSGRAVTAPRVGERRAQFRLGIEVAAGGEKVTLVADVLAFQKGRSLAMLMFFAPFRPLAGQAAVARAVAARMR